MKKVIERNVLFTCVTHFLMKYVNHWTFKKKIFKNSYRRNQNNENVLEFFLVFFFFFQKERH